MKFFNRFSIEEDDQFEIQNVYQMKKWFGGDDAGKVFNNEKISEAIKEVMKTKELNQVHFIWAGLDYYKIINYFKKEMKQHGLNEAMFTFIRMLKSNCITKETFEKEYQVDKDIDERDDLSIGEDLESFIRRIKLGEINKQTIPKYGERKKSFKFSLLNEDEKRKLEIKDEDFMMTFLYEDEADVPDAEMKMSESKLKFARSYCYRITYLINAEDEEYKEDSELDNDTESDSDNDSDSNEFILQELPEPGLD